MYTEEFYIYFFVFNLFSDVIRKLRPKPIGYTQLLSTKRKGIYFYRSLYMYIAISVQYLVWKTASVL